jgi:hypothetical protein
MAHFPGEFHGSEDVGAAGGDGFADFLDIPENIWYAPDSLRFKVFIGEER